MNYISKEDLQEAINASTSKAECFNFLGLHTTSNYSYKSLNYYIKLYDLNIDKFTNNKIGKNNIKINLKDILDGKYPSYTTSKLRVRLIKENIFSHQCSICSLTEWNDKPIPLDLDHINGDPTDHRLENIRLLCRNCHAQTSNFCGANVKKRSVKIKPERPKKIKPEIIRKEIYNYRTGELTTKIKDDMEIIKNCDIDFTKYGWVTKLATLLGKKPQKINRWMKKYMPEILEKSFQKSNNLAAVDGIGPP